MAAGGSGNQQGSQANRDKAAAKGFDAGYKGGGSGSGGFGGGLGFGGGRTASVIGNRFGAPSASAQAAARARNTPAPGLGGGFNPQQFGGRRTVNPTPSYEMSLHNMMALGGMLPGPGMAANVAKMAMGYGPQFSGSAGTVNGPGDYDGPNRFGTGLGMGQYQQPRPAVPLRPAIQGPQNQGLGMSNMGAMNFGYQPFNGMQGSQWTRPGYSFIGRPGT